jgi:hypothetical protein
VVAVHSHIFQETRRMSIFMRAECGAIGEILNVIAGFLPLNSQTSSGRTCTNGLRRSTLT